MKVFINWIEKKQTVLAVLLVFVLCCGARFYRFADKETMYGDEFLSIVIASYSDYGCTVVAQTGDEGMTGKELKQLIFRDDNSIRNIALDLWTMWKSPLDVDHTNLYYSLLRITQLNGDLVDLDDVMWRAFLLNLVFFGVSFFFLYKLIRLFTSNPCIILIGLIVAYLLPLGIASTLFVREYQMQEMFFLIFTYLVVKYGLRIEQHERVFKNKKEIFLFGLSIALALLSGYFGVLYMIFLGAAMFFLMLYRKSERKDIQSLFAVALCALFLVLAMCPNFFDALAHGRSDGVLGRFASVSSLSDGLLCYYKDLNSEMTNTYVPFPLFFLLLFLTVLFSLKSIREDKKFALLLFVIIASVVWALLVFYLAPYRVMRYISAVFPIISLSVVFLLRAFDRKLVLYVVSSVVVVLVFFQSVRKTDVYWGRSNIEYRYKEFVHLPLVVYSVGLPMVDASLASLYADDRMIYTVFADEVYKQVLNRYDEVCMITGKPNPSLPLGYSIEEQIFSEGEWNLYGFKVKRDSVVIAK